MSSSKVTVTRHGYPLVLTQRRHSLGARGAAEKAVDGSSTPMRPISGFSSCAARSRMHDALAPLLVASPGSGPPGSPNLSPKVFGRASYACVLLWLLKRRAFSRFPQEAMVHQRLE